MTPKPVGQKKKSIAPQDASVSNDSSNKSFKEESPPNPSPGVAQTALQSSESLKIDAAAG